MSGRGGAGGRGPLLDRDEFRLISSYWPEYFPDEVGLLLRGGCSGSLRSVSAPPPLATF